MRCAGCGQGLTENGASVCLNCGTPVPREYAMAAAPKHAAVLRPDPVLPSGDNWVQASVPTGPYGGYAPQVVPPPPPAAPFGAAPYSYETLPYPETPKKKLSWRSPRVLGIIAVLLVVVSTGTIALRAYASGALFAKHSATTTGGDLGGDQVQFTNPKCDLPTVDNTAAKNILSPTLTTGLSDITKKDYTPIDNVSIFHVGTTIYFTFTIATDDSANLKADWCWGPRGDKTHYQLSVSHNQGISGYFNLQNLDKTAKGAGVIVIHWNDAVAAVLPFSVIA